MSELKESDVIDRVNQSGAVWVGLSPWIWRDEMSRLGLMDIWERHHCSVMRGWKLEVKGTIAEHGARRILLHSICISAFKASIGCISSSANLTDIQNFSVKELISNISIQFRIGYRIFLLSLFFILSLLCNYCQSCKEEWNKERQILKSCKCSSIKY